jgi:hypothetical protein
LSRFKLILRVGGTILFAVGLFGLPRGYGDGYLDAKRATSAFNNIADLGGFLSIGLILLGVGLIAFIVSFLLPGQIDEDYWG